MGLGSWGSVRLAALADSDISSTAAWDVGVGQGELKKLKELNSGRA